MTSDRPVAYDGSRIFDISRDRYFQLMQAEKDLRALRLALREPSDELLDKIAGIMLKQFIPASYVSQQIALAYEAAAEILAAFAEAVTPDDQ
jgi:hypothetical protein